MPLDVRYADGGVAVAPVSVAGGDVGLFTQPLPWEEGYVVRPLARLVDGERTFTFPAGLVIPAGWVQAVRVVFVYALVGGSVSVVGSGGSVSVRALGRARVVRVAFGSGQSLSRGLSVGLVFSGVWCAGVRAALWAAPE